MESGPKARIGFAQTEPVFGDVSGNLERAAKLVAQADDFDVLVLPELFSTGYTFLDRDEVERYAEDSDGPTQAALREWASRRAGWVVGGFAERAGERLFNSAALIGPDGETHVYRKIHLFDRETDLFDPGPDDFRVQSLEIPTGLLRVGMMICFDWFFPESARCLAVAGADVILHPSNLVMSSCQDAMPTRCLENGVFAVTANRCGADDRGEIRVDFTGASQVTGPRGEVLSRAPATGETVVVVEVDVSVARDKSLTPRNDRLGSRRPERYGALVARGAGDG